MRVKSVHSLEDIPPLLRSREDVVALDGHGWTDGLDAYFGIVKVFTQFCPDYLCGEEDRGVVAPIVVLAFCHGGDDPFRDVIERCINRDHVAFLGSTHTGQWPMTMPIASIRRCSGCWPNSEATPIPSPGMHGSN
jgi:hypothetical protein